MMATLVQAVRMALHYGEEHLGVTDIFGEDVGPPLGGVFTATQGLKTAWNSPLDERGIIGTAMGIAYAGGRPVAEFQFCDYSFNTIDLLKVAGNQRWAGVDRGDRGELRPDTAAVRPGSRSTARRARPPLRRDRPAEHFPVRLEGDQSERAENGAGADRQRGHRSHQLRRARAAPRHRRA